MPAMRAAPSTSPFLALPESTSASVFADIATRPCATATRSVAGLSDTSTMRASPPAEMWVSLRGVIAGTAVALPLPACGERGGGSGSRGAGGGGGGGGGGASPRVAADVVLRGDSAPLTPTLSPQERGEGARALCQTTVIAAHSAALAERAALPLSSARVAAVT